MPAHAHLRNKRGARNATIVKRLVVLLAGVIWTFDLGCTVVPSPSSENANANTSTADNGPTDDGDSDATRAALLTVGDDEHIQGSADAPVTVIEYVDFQCAICRDFALNTLPSIIPAFIDTGDVRWVIRQFPVRSIHEFAEAAAQASECAADQGRFVDYEDVLYENQPDFTLDELNAYADDLGLDTAAFSTCLSTSAKSGDVADDLASGLLLGVAGTPTFFINGQGVFGGLNFDAFSARLETALEEVRQQDDSPFGEDLFP